MITTESNLQKQYQTELWQYLRYNNDVLNVTFTFSPMYGDEMWTVKIFVNDKVFFTDYGTQLWKRMKNAIDKLKELGFKDCK